MLEQAQTGTFDVSQTCYRYQPKLSDENALIVEWLVRLTYNQKNWGFDLCFPSNQVWSMDFMHDRLSDGHSFRLFNVLDDFNREGLGGSRSTCHCVGAGNP